MSLEMNLSRKEQKEYEQWLREMQETVRLEPIREETDEQKGRRKASLLKKPSRNSAVIISKTSWMPILPGSTKNGVGLIVENDNIMFVGEWPREHAKSVVMDIFLPMYLKALGKLTGVVLSSANEDKADGLLADLQEQLMFNQRYIADYGPQYKSGKWDTGHFVTNDGIGFLGIRSRTIPAWRT